MIKRTIGIDFSIRAPGIVIHDGETWDGKNCQFHFINPPKGSKKFDGFLHVAPFIQGQAYPEYKTEEERFEKLTENIMNLFELSVPLDKVDLAIEGYAMGARGKVFNIGEATGLLKNKLWMQDCKFSIYAPTAVKKFATGKGTAKKEQMIEAFTAETGINFTEILGLKSIKGGPISDIVDAYWICKMKFFNGEPPDVC